MRGLSRLRALRADERGASLALVALSLVWILGMASLVIDIGDGWLTRQTLIPATDAGALAAAQDLVDRPWDEQAACATAGTYVAGNAPAATMTDCDVVSFGPDGGRVTVTASESVDATFAAVGTAEGRSAQSVSTATWGPPLTVSGLRPLALCYDGSADLRQLIDNPPSGPTWVEVRSVKDDPDACGGSSAIANFATLDFEGGTGIHELRDWMRDGYPGQVDFDDPTVSSCGAGATCYERPWALLDLTWQLASLRNSGSYVAFPVFNYADADEVHLIGLVRARLYAFDLVGPWTDWSFELKVDPGLITGTCCGPPGVLSGNEVIAVCGVDPGAYLACEPSTGP
ncbi:MAG: hypothetical protein OEV40_07155 [Acidimicrobiia bacterium]|nr:hypothetical protein [Acidimicrobiia bacterium]